MTFKNEYVPPLEQETSEFFSRAQKILTVMAEKRSKWTVDREREMVLVLEGSGREIEDANHDLWGFIDRKGYYVFSTDRLSKTEVSLEEIAITYKIRGFWQGAQYSSPDTKTIACIKEALRERKDWGLLSDYKTCRLTLIDSNGKEI